jgi:Tfp pilus assembly protein PilX
MPAPHNCKQGLRLRAARRRRERGGAIIGVIFVILILTVLVMGSGTLAIGHQNLENVDEDYAAALDLAEAGVNYELRKISQNTANADQYPGGTYTLGSGTFKVYCTNQDGSTPWSVSNNLFVVATGTVDRVTRTVKVSVQGGPATANYALFGINSGSINGSASQTNGDIGTNGWINFNGHPGVSGKVIFNGATSNWQAPPNGTYTTEYNSSPVVWPTVDSIANTAFPSGGLTWLSTHNDNALASPAITSNMILLNGSSSMTLTGKPGGANYYLTSLTCNGNAKINFDNTNGPINIFMGPSGGSGTFVFNGGTSAIKMSADNTKPVKMYVATNNDVIFNGNNQLDAGVYNYNGANSGKIIFNGNPTVYGSFVSNAFILNGNPTINYQAGLFQTTGTGYYGYNNSWTELNSR